MGKLLLQSCLALLLALPALADSSSLCQTSQNQISFAAERVAPRSANEFSMITWNAHKLADSQFLPDLLNLSQSADLILVQEAMHYGSLQSLFSYNFQMGFSFHKSFCNKEDQATGVMTASRYPLESSRTLVSTDTEPFTFTPKVSGYSAIHIPEIGLVHVINTHGLNFNTGSKFVRQINEIAAFIRQLQGPVIWAGDFNTWIGMRKNHLNARAAELGLQHLTPANDHRRLKLDHIYVRGLRLKQVELLNDYHSSDHTPMRAVFEKVPAETLYESLPLADDGVPDALDSSDSPDSQDITVDGTADTVDGTAAMDTNSLSSLHQDSDN